MRNYLKTCALLAAAVIYVPLVTDWLMPGNGLHQATVVLGGYGSDALRPLGDFCLWDLQVRLIGWDLRGLGALSMFWALVSLGLVACVADRATHGVSSLSTGLLCAAFIATPGFLRAATRPDPLMALLAVLLAGFALLMWILTKSGHGTRTRKSPREWCLALGSLLLLAYGFLGFCCLEFLALMEDLVHLLWFAVLGVLPYLVLMRRMRRNAVSPGFQAWFFGIWIAAIAISANVAAKSFNGGRASGRLAEQFIANVGADPSIAKIPALADVYIWTLPAERRDAVLASRPALLNRLPPSVERYLPTAELWHAGLTDFVAMKSGEPHREYYRDVFRTCGDRLGKQLLDAGELKGAWSVFQETLDKVDGKDEAAILGLCELIARGYEVDAESRGWLGRRLLPFFSRMKIPERQVESEMEATKAMQRAIRLGISRGFVRLEQIGQKLLKLDLLLEDWESAERDARGILSLDRQNALANAVRGVLLSRQGNSAAAGYHFRLAVDRARFLRGAGDAENMRDTLRVLKDLKGLGQDLQMEIRELEGVGK